MFERPQQGRRAVLVHVDFHNGGEREDLDEFRELVISAGLLPVALITATRQSPNPKFLVGSGKLEEIRASAAQHEADIILFNHSLTSSQERNLERELKLSILDRTGLILDIFAQRARSHEGRLQVELAQMEHLSTRLVRGWTHLERQRGGIGVRGGPGETQIEIDRRLLRERIKQLNKRLEKVGQRRAQNRAARRKVPLPTVSLVGYTNAGKSTVFNGLTQAGVYAADQLFATLDPTLRRVEFADASPIILADTVGFIRHLPHSLIAAFHATLEETCNAGLLLHIVDAHHDQRHANMEQVNAVLKEIGAGDVYQIEVYNKIDLLPDGVPRIERDEQGRIHRIWISAATGAGLDLLRAAIAEFFCGAKEILFLRLPLRYGRLRAKLYEIGQVLSEQVADDGHWLIELKVEKDRLRQLHQHDDFNGAMILDPAAKRLAGAA